MENESASLIMEPDTAPVTTEPTVPTNIDHLTDHISTPKADNNNPLKPQEPVHETPSTGSTTNDTDALQPSTQQNDSSTQPDAHSSTQPDAHSSTQPDAVEDSIDVLPLTGNVINYPASTKQEQPPSSSDNSELPFSSQSEEQQPTEKDPEPLINSGSAEPPNQNSVATQPNDEMDNQHIHGDTESPVSNEDTLNMNERAAGTTATTTENPNVEQSVDEGDEVADQDDAQDKKKQPPIHEDKQVNEVQSSLQPNSTSLPEFNVGNIAESPTDQESKPMNAATIVTDQSQTEDVITNGDIITTSDIVANGDIITTSDIVAGADTLEVVPDMVTESTTDKLNLSIEESVQKKKPVEEENDSRENTTHRDDAISEEHQSPEHEEGEPGAAGVVLSESHLLATPEVGSSVVAAEPKKKKKHHKKKREVFESIPAPSKADASYSKVAVMSSPRTQSVFQSTPQVLKYDAGAGLHSPEFEQKNLYEKEGKPSQADATASSAAVSNQKRFVFQNTVNPSTAHVRAGESTQNPAREAGNGVFESQGRPSGASVRAGEPVKLTPRDDQQNHFYSNVPAASSAHARTVDPRGVELLPAADASTTVYASNPETSKANVTWNQELQPKTDRTVFEYVPNVQVEPSARWDKSCDKSRDMPSVFQNQPQPSMADAGADQDVSDGSSEESSDESVSDGVQSDGVSENTMEHHQKEIEAAMQTSSC